MKRSARSFSRTVLKMAWYAIVLVTVLLFVAPFLYMISTSLKSQTQMLMQPRAFFPMPLNFGNFGTVLRDYDIILYLFNTAVVVVGSLVGTVAVSTLAGYAFARIEFRGRETLFILTLSTMFMPLFLIIIPRFLIFKTIGVLGTLIPLILPTAFGSPFAIFLTRQYLKGIPMDLNEAARIDGCGEFRTYLQIIMPLSKTLIATIIIFVTQWKWNNFIEPLIYLQSEKLYTITMGLYMVIGQGAEEVTTHLVMAFLILTNLPLVLIFLVAQRQFVEGVSHSGIK